MYTVQCCDRTDVYFPGSIKHTRKCKSIIFAQVQCGELSISMSATIVHMFSTSDSHYFFVFIVNVLSVVFFFYQPRTTCILHENTKKKKLCKV